MEYSSLDKHGPGPVAQLANFMWADMGIIKVRGSNTWAILSSPEEVWDKNGTSMNTRGLLVWQLLDRTILMWCARILKSNEALTHYQTNLNLQWKKQAGVPAVDPVQLKCCWSTSVKQRETLSLTLKRTTAGATQICTTKVDDANLSTPGLPRNAIIWSSMCVLALPPSRPPPLLQPQNVSFHPP